MSSRTVPELTSIRYPNVVRGDFGSMAAADVEFFKKILSHPGQVLTDEDELMSYNVDWMGSYRGVWNCVALLDSLQQLLDTKTSKHHPKTVLVQQDIS